MKTLASLTLSFVIGIVLAGCATAPDVMVSPYTTTTFPPSASATMLHAFPTDRHYVELAELSARMLRTTQEQAPLAMLEKAKSLGADAVVVTEPKRQSHIGEIPVLVLTGVAIRYDR